MGTRYNISREDVQKLLDAGVATNIEGEEEIWKEEWDETYHCYREVELLAKLKSVAIGGWQFTTVIWDRYNDKLSGTYSGPNWGKEELSEIFEKFEIKPEYY
jgi:hypothetical protein